MRNLSNIMSSRYLDLTTDAGFKAVFCNPQNKPLLISLINSFLPADRKIVSLNYADRGIDGLAIDNKHIVLDLHCTDEQGREFIVELQKRSYQSFYLRSLYYATRVFNSNLTIGDNYFRGLKPVYLIALLCEPLKEPELKGLNDLVLWYCMQEKNKKSFAPDGIKLIFADISKAAKLLLDSKNESETFCHIIREIGSSTINPDDFGQGVFAQLAKAAELANVDINKLKQYESSVMTELDYKAWLYESREEGREIGKEEGKLEIAKAMIKKGIDLETISDCCGLRVEELQRLK